jgi:glycosyltransferase involved in cell wall biosynthesis
MTVNSFPWSRDYLSSRSVQSVADAVVWGNLDAVLCPALIVMKGLTDDRGMPRALGRLLRYGVEEPPFEPGEEDALRGRLAPGGGPLVGMVSARADKGKGYEVFVEALARVDGLRGVLVGPHPGEEFVAHVDRLGLGERLALEGPQRPVWPYYAAMDALVVPSTEYECMPFVILEAMAIGRPAIGSHLSGIPEAIADGETGRTFPPGDVDGLAAILSDLVSSREAWRRMGAAARRRYERHFTWTKMRSELISLYASLAGSEDSQLTAGGGSRPADMSSPTDAGDAPRARSA